MTSTNAKYIKVSKNDPNESKLLDYLKDISNSPSTRKVTFDEFGDDAMIQIKDQDYIPSISDVLYP